MVFATLVGLAVRVTMSAEQRQQMLFDITGRDAGAAQVCRLERLSEAEGQVDRHQRVEHECKEAEPRGPNPASPHCPSHVGSPTVVVLPPGESSALSEYSATARFSQF